MEFIIHRVNKIKDLKSLPKKFGVEIDIRTKGSKLILNHEPFNKGDILENYLENYGHKTLVLNLKEAGIEKENSDVFIHTVEMITIRTDHHDIPEVEAGIKLDIEKDILHEVEAGVKKNTKIDIE